MKILSKKIVAIIQARIGSTRLPAKAMLSLHGYTIFEWVIRRAKRSSLVDEVIVAIPENKENDILEHEANRIGVQVFRGSEEDVLSRFYFAAKETEATEVVRICADNPLIDPAEIDNLIKFYAKNLCDYAYNHIPKNNLYPDGFGAEIVSFSVLKQIFKESKLLNQREHAFLYIWDNPKKFRILTFNPLDSNLNRPDLKFDIDTLQDYIYLLSTEYNMEVSAKEIVQLFNKI